MNPALPRPFSPPWLRTRDGIALALAACLHLGGWAALEHVPTSERAPERVLSGMLLPPPPGPAERARVQPSSPRPAPRAQIPSLAQPLAAAAPARESGALATAEVSRAPASEAVADSRGAPAGTMPAGAPDAPPVEGTPAEEAPDFRADYLNNPQPAYPLLSRKQRERGMVRLRVRVAATGNAEQVLLHAGSGHPRLDTAALAAVRAWRFTPARRNGVAVAGWVEVPIQFTLEN